ncbi:sulfate transporter CysZ [Pseudomaricurvus sp. HS19]|uniref:sulfate transporter CysZ n=1 Tax=Pseudomaricurvus sp. HS19 TaxID=2692626 RepID=UPI001369022B|nr:sulfate transporter CysZ [Pseudomaricurvus sp. HS19]
MPNHLINGLTYLTRGAQLIVHPQLRWFVLVPVLINIVLFVIITSMLIGQFGAALDWLLSGLPGWLDFLAWILWVLFSIVLLLVYGYSFSVITNIIAAPFYGVLAERAEILIKGSGPRPETLLHMIPRTLGREMVKLWYFIVRGVAILILSLVLSWIPLLNFLIPVIVFVWGAWSMAIQYVDYSADNHQLPFSNMRDRLAARKYTSIGFGGLVMVGTMLPLANIFILPIAVVGGTVFWTEELEDL